jgi:hypothetical protein
MGVSHRTSGPPRRRRVGLLLLLACLVVLATACVDRWSVTASNESAAGFLVRLEDGPVGRVFTIPAHASLVIDEGWGAFVGRVQVLTEHCQVVTGAQTKAQYVVISIDAAEKASVTTNNEPMPGLAPAGRAETATGC